jgi:tetratricopeptide (TPR) repeat protein
MISFVENGIRTADDEYDEARGLMESGQPALALPILARLVAFEPRNDEILEAWISAHLDLERYQKVIEIADAAIAAGRDRARLEFWKAVAYDKQNQPESAEACARTAVAIEPGYSAANILLTLLLEKQDRNEEALDICRRAAAANPDDDDLALRVIEIANALHRPELVADSARSYLKRFGRNAAVLSHLGNACLDLKEFRKAERAFRDAAALEPDVAGHHFSIVMLSLLRGDEAGADAYLDKLASRDEELADAVAAAVDQFFEEVKEADENL